MVRYYKSLSREKIKHNNYTAHLKDAALDV